MPSNLHLVLGALNKLPLAISGLVFFDAPVTPASVSAIFVGFVSGIVYAVAKINQNKDAKPALPTTLPVATPVELEQSEKGPFKA